MSTPRLPGWMGAAATAWATAGAVSICLHVSEPLCIRRGRLFDTLKAEGLAFDEPVGCHMFEPDEDGRRNLVLFAGLRQGQPAAPCLRVENQPAGGAAATRRVGSYEQLGLAHAALFAWAHGHRRCKSGPVARLHPPQRGAPGLLSRRGGHLRRTG